MTKPFLLVQLSDPHIGATWTRSDPAARWQAAIRSVARLPDPPDAVLVSGDLVEHGTDDEYAVVKSALDALDVPARVLPGKAAAPHETTVLAMHHPPFASGMRAWARSVSPHPIEQR